MQRLNTSGKYVNKKQLQVNFACCIYEKQCNKCKSTCIQAEYIYIYTVNSEIIACIYYWESCDAGDNANFNIAIQLIM